MGTLDECAPERVSQFSAKVSRVRWEIFPSRLLEQKVVIESVCLKCKIGVDTFQRKGEVETCKPVQIFDNLYQGFLTLLLEILVSFL